MPLNISDKFKYIEIEFMIIYVMIILLNNFNK